MTYEQKLQIFNDIVLSKEHDFIVYVFKNSKNIYEKIDFLHTKKEIIFFEQEIYLEWSKEKTLLFNINMNLDIIISSETKVKIFYDYIQNNSPEIRFDIYQVDEMNQLICQFSTKNQIELLAQVYILGYYGKN